ncbi:hypothetical protein MPTK1_1g21300 [Marchantia polymorpha subsp. ruderalis]|uniref:Uncharacterized protein n=2 Tax=Marchantia polymorpha TaxID=3197 RepID=A0AAF6ASL4_MARPO|nr:hypothetical protein MARPO_0001s0465 [Marchantia polymorpha]BBM99434.1 hypothetical protein Mp_1g21300 [Marchantia polymorpha subsp. ruderalis]|eukprot:PTQ50516.1 hypothetical protein MARPO_0001s0465 [Marchantia polymorpha]
MRAVVITLRIETVSYPIRRAEFLSILIPCTPSSSSRARATCYFTFLPLDFCAYCELMITRAREPERERERVCFRAWMRTSTPRRTPWYFPNPILLVLLWRPRSILPSLLKLTPNAISWRFTSFRLFLPLFTRASRSRFWCPSPPVAAALVSEPEPSIHRTHVALTSARACV